MRVGLSPVGETCMPIGIWASPRQSDCRKRAAARKRVSVLMKQWCCLSKSDARSGMRASVRGGTKAAPSPWRKAGGGEAGRSNVVNWDGRTKAVSALSMRTGVLAVGGFEASRADLVIRGMELNFLGAATSVWSTRNSAEGSEKFTSRSGEGAAFDRDLRVRALR